jgi:hypothetical protein
MGYLVDFDKSYVAFKAVGFRRTKVFIFGMQVWHIKTECFSSLK